MTADPLPITVRQLLAGHIQTVEQLEVLLLLRSDPTRAWTINDIYGVVRSSHASIQTRLRNFVAEGFLAEDKGPPQKFRFAPKDQNLRSAVDQTASAYQAWRLRVIEAIFARHARNYLRDRI